MNRIIKKISVLCVVMCTITSPTHCMLLLQKSKTIKPSSYLMRKAALSKPRLRLMLARQARFYNAGVEVSNAQILLAIEENNRTMNEILKEIRKQSLQTTVTTPVTTHGGEVDYRYKPATNEGNKYQYTAESDLSCKDLYNMHYGNQ